MKHRRPPKPRGHKLVTADTLDRLHRAHGGDMLAGGGWLTVTTPLGKFCAVDDVAVTR